MSFSCWCFLVPLIPRCPLTVVAYSFPTKRCVPYTVYDWKLYFLSCQTHYVNTQQLMQTACRYYFFFFIWPNSSFVATTLKRCIYFTSLSLTCLSFENICLVGDNWLLCKYQYHETSIQSLSSNYRCNDWCKNDDDENSNSIYYRCKYDNKRVMAIAVTAQHDVTPHDNIQSVYSKIEIANKLCRNKLAVTKLE